MNNQSIIAVAAAIAAYSTYCPASPTPFTQAQISAYALASVSLSDPESRTYNSSFTTDFGSTIRSIGFESESEGLFDPSVGFAQSTTDASSLAIADFGQLGVAASGTFNAVWDPDRPEGGYSLGEYSDGADAEYDDYITVVSTDLPLGTPVSLLMFLSFEGSTLDTTTEDNDVGAGNIFLRSGGQASVTISGTGASVSFCVDDPAGPVSPMANCDIMNGPVDLLGATTATLFVGQTYLLSGAMSADASGEGGVNGPTSNEQIGSSMAYFPDTASTYLEPLNDFSLVTASGHDYSLPLSVPEPGSLALLGVSLAGMVLIRRRPHRPF